MPKDTSSPADAPLGDILGCVKTDAEAVDLTLFSTASAAQELTAAAAYTAISDDPP